MRTLIALLVASTVSGAFAQNQPDTAKRSKYRAILRGEYATLVKKASFGPEAKRVQVRPVSTDKLAQPTLPLPLYREGVSLEEMQRYHP